MHHYFSNVVRLVVISTFLLVSAACQDGSAPSQQKETSAPKATPASAPTESAAPAAKASAAKPAVAGALPKPGRIGGKEGHLLVEAGAMLLDVRSKREFSGKKIDGSKNIPLNELGSRMGELGPKDTKIVVYCLSGARSRGAVSLLNRAGYTNVWDMGTFRVW